METTAYTLHIDDGAIADLRDRLRQTCWPVAEPAADESWGLPQPVARELVAYWAEEFDWRAQEARINQVPQFTAPIDGHDLHFFHVRSRREDATPLVLLHGWPGSSTELLGMVDGLAEPPSGQPAFHVVVPSLPGMSLGGAVTGWDAGRTAATVGELMAGLGYTGYWVHGYDFGAIVARTLAMSRPNDVALLHLTQLLQGERLTEQTADKDDPWDQKVLAAARRYDWELSAYGMLQSTRPETLAPALSDSPAGLMSWLVDGYRAWAATPDALSRDEMLTTVSLYWFFGTIATSIRYYKSGAGDWGAEQQDCPVPLALAPMPDDIGLPVRRLAEKHHEVVRWHVMSRGGHFAGWEQPDAMVTELREARTELGRAPAR